MRLLKNVMRLLKNVMGPLINAMESTGAQQPGKAFTITQELVCGGFMHKTKLLLHMWVWLCT